MRHPLATLILLSTACATTPLREPTLGLADAIACGASVPLAREILRGGKPAVAALSASVMSLSLALESGEPLTDEQVETVRQLAAALRDLEGCM